MNTKYSWLTRMFLGGACAVALVLLLPLPLYFLTNSITWGGPDYGDIQLTTEQAAAYFGSIPAALTVELSATFLLGAAIGLSTLPFAETWPSLLGLSTLHFVVTGALAMLVGWSYLWLGLDWWIFLILYLSIYLIIWLCRWAFWNSELRKMRKALGLNKKEDD